MHRARATEELSDVHAAALKLRERGLGDEAIARRLAIPREAVAPLLAIATAKLAALPEQDVSARAPHPGSGSGEPGSRDV